MINIALQNLEDSPEQFWERFSSGAQAFEAAPEPMGSPLLELITPFGPIFAFDRGLSPLQDSVPTVLLCGQAESIQNAENSNHQIENLGKGRYKITGLTEPSEDKNHFWIICQSPSGSVKVLVSFTEKPQFPAVVCANLFAPLMAFRDEWSH